MIQVIAGKKGSGKTKRLIEMTNKTAAEAATSVVFLDDDDSYMYEVSSNARFVNAGEYGVHSPEMFVGFISGMLSQNYDIGTIFVDAFCKLTKVDLAKSDWIFQAMEVLSAKHNVNFVCSISEDPAVLPEFVSKYII